MTHPSPRLHPSSVARAASLSRCNTSAAAGGAGTAAGGSSSAGESPSDSRKGERRGEDEPERSEQGDMMLPSPQHATRSSSLSIPSMSASTAAASAVFALLSPDPPRCAAAPCGEPLAWPLSCDPIPASRAGWGSAGPSSRMRKYSYVWMSMHVSIFAPFGAIDAPSRMCVAGASSTHSLPSVRGLKGLTTSRFRGAIPFLSRRWNRADDGCAGA
mmetsp:Transcript_11903/g.29158  ORF Transcript_11903/g.29158 Transcript_11903/m.29158 type:complete len:215 (-) Transcript_11903:230-874(-)